MLNISDTGLILSAKHYKEKQYIVKILTRDNGLYSGILRGKNIPQILTLVQCRWKTRTAEQIGFWDIDVLKSFSVIYFDDALRLAGLVALSDTLLQLSPEHQNIYIFDDVMKFLKKIDSDNWVAEYVRLEMALLSKIGFGLDLSDQVLGDLYYVSPKTGKAVSKEKGWEYRDKLLKIPAFLWKNDIPTMADICQGFKLIDFFLSPHLKKNTPRQTFIQKIKSS